MNDPALIRGHRTKIDVSLLVNGLVSRRTSDGFYLLPLTALIPFHIDHDRVTESHLASSDSGHEELQSIERATVTADEHSKIVSGYIENELAFIAFVLVDGYLAYIEALEYILQDRDSRISYFIKLFVSDLLVIVLDDLFHFVRLLFLDFLSHEISSLQDVSRETSHILSGLALLRRALLLFLTSNVDFYRLHFNGFVLFPYAVLTTTTVHGKLILTDTDERRDAPEEQNACR